MFALARTRFAPARLVELQICRSFALANRPRRRIQVAPSPPPLARELAHFEWPAGLGGRRRALHTNKRDK